MQESLIHILSSDIGKVLSRATQGATPQSQQLRTMIDGGGFEGIMATIEADTAMNLLVRNCITNPNSTDCIGVFSKSLLKILESPKIQGGEKSKRLSGPDGFEEIELEPHEKLGMKIQELYMDDWHTGKNLEDFSVSAREYIDLFAEYYYQSSTESGNQGEEDYYDDDELSEAEEQDYRPLIAIDLYDMGVLKTIVSAAQSYMLYLGADKQRLRAERDTNGRWHQIRIFVDGLRWLSGQSEIGKSINSLEYKYFNTITGLLVEWDALAMEINDL